MNGSLPPSLTVLTALLLWTAPAQAGEAAHVVVAGPTWPAPMRVGSARGVTSASKATIRRKWCNYGLHTQRLQPLPLAQDAVFRRPTPASRQALRSLVERVVALAPGRPIAAHTQAAMTALMRSSDGPTLARISLQHKDPRVRLLAARSATVVVRRHPRLAGFAMERIPDADPDLAIAVMRCLMAARCDTPAVHATDGLEHKDRRVRAATIDAVLRSAAAWSDIGLMGQLLQHVGSSELDPLLRATVARGMAELGWLPAGPLLAKLAQDPDPRVRGEALVALAAVQRHFDRKLLHKALKSKDAVLRAAAIRAAPLALAGRRSLATSLLSPLVGDSTRVLDPLAVSKATTVGALAQLALEGL